MPIDRDRRSIVADTNIVLDHVFGRSAASIHLMNLVILGKIELFETRETIDEYRDTAHFLSRRRRPVNAESAAIAFSKATTLELPDPDAIEFPHLGTMDQVFLRLFLETDADALVTRDRHLRNVRGELPADYRCRIVKPEECLAFPWAQVLLEKLGRPQGSLHLKKVRPLKV